jgi:hypothetical protein
VEYVISVSFLIRDLPRRDQKRIAPDHARECSVLVRDGNAVETSLLHQWDALDDRLHEFSTCHDRSTEGEKTTVSIEESDEQTDEKTPDSVDQHRSQAKGYPNHHPSSEETKNRDAELRPPAINTSTISFVQSLLVEKSTRSH